MAYPQQPGYPPAPPQDPQQAPYPGQGYPQQAPPQAPYPGQGYPQQAPPQAPYPGQGYPQQAPPQAPYPGQGYPQQAPPQAPPLPPTGLSDFLDQPVMGGQSLQFNAIGDSWTGKVARELVDGPGDFPVQTERDGVTPKKFRDGRLMVRMVVPLLVRPDERHPDGHATLSIQGQASEALKQAMSAAGAGHRRGIPEEGAVITATWVSIIPPKTQGFSPTKIYQYVYQRPPGAAQAEAANWQRETDAIMPPVQPAAPVGQQPVPQPGGQIPPYGPPAPLTAPAGVTAQAYQPPAPVPQYQVPPPPPVPSYGPVQPGQPVSQPVPPQGYPQPDVAGQVASATQAGVQAAQAVRQPVITAENAALIAQITGQQPQ